MTYANVFEILAEFVRLGDDFALHDPLLEILELTTENKDLEDVLQTQTSILRQVFEACVEFVHLCLLQRDSVTTITQQLQHSAIEPCNYRVVTSLPVRMFVIDQIATALAQFSNVLRVILDRLLENAVLLQHVVGT